MGILMSSELKEGDEVVVRFVKLGLTGWDLWEKAEIYEALLGIAQKHGVKLMIFAPEGQSDTVVTGQLPGVDDRLIAEAVNHNHFMTQVVPAGTYNGRHLQ